MTKKKLKS